MIHTGHELLDPYAVLDRTGIDLGWHVADMGCGSLGHFVFPAAEMVGGDGRVYAVDIQKTALHAVEKTAKYEQFWNVHPVWSDIEKVGAAKIPSGSIDLTIVGNNLVLSQQRENLVQECLRLTKPGGLILIIEWKKQPTPFGPPLERRLTVEEAQSLFQIPELSHTQSFDAGAYHYGFICERIAHEPHVRVLSMSGPMEM